MIIIFKGRQNCTSQKLFIMFPKSLSTFARSGKIDEIMILAYDLTNWRKLYYVNN